jgi:LPS-assembly protein
LHPLRFLLPALAAGLLGGEGRTWAQTAAADALQKSPIVLPLPKGEAAKQLPIVLRADRITGRPDLDVLADGSAEFRRAGLVLKADRLSYDSPEDLARATGHVRISNGGVIYSGPELQLRVQRFEGFFLQPEFDFHELGAGGRADRIDFIDSTRSLATRAQYTSCPRDGPDEPAWLLRADTVRLDLEANEGLASGAVLRFQGLPILALPLLSFPLSDERKSGWLPPSFDTDNRSGIELSAPYYWNIAPNRDATFTPRILTRRGLGLNTELRYLEPGYEGTAAVDWLPSDKLAGTSRHAMQWAHEAHQPDGLRYGANVVRVSDDQWWKDFPSPFRSFTPRLLPLRAFVEQAFDSPGGNGLVYARAVQWQVLQGSDSTVVSPYERTPQVGLQITGRRLGFGFGLETEYNRFSLPRGDDARAGRTGGERIHLLGHLSRSWREPGWWVTPRLAANAAHYDHVTAIDGVKPRASRVIPTFSVDAGFELERSTVAFGRPFQQTLEPRLLYVRTPYRLQSTLPNYDSAAKDFSFASIYTENQFSGVDRVNDANQVTLGMTTRYIDPASGAEALRVALLQRVLFSTQRVTAQADGTVDGPPLQRRLSDAYLVGNTSVLPNWSLDASLQYSPDVNSLVRTVLGARYSPGPFRTVGASYLLARGQSEQTVVGWQWPVYGTGAEAAASRQAGPCSGTWYSVGRVNYSMREKRIADSVLGVEYDAGCWIARFVTERLSTSSTDSTTKIMLQLELVGLSRIGSNPLRFLKENIPGYRLLRDERGTSAPTADRSAASFYE